MDKIVEFINTKALSDDFWSTLPIDTPLFECIPPKIIFSDYDALDVKKQIIRLRNRDSCARRVKVIKPSSNIFRIERIQNSSDDVEDSLGNKIAPGLDL